MCVIKLIFAKTFLYVREACKYTDTGNYVAMYRKNNICISCVLMALSIFTITHNYCYVGSLVSMLQMKQKDHKFGILFYDIFYIFTITPKYCNVGSPLRLSIFCDKIYYFSRGTKVAYRAKTHIFAPERYTDGILYTDTLNSA